MFRDLSFAVRTLLRQPSFTAIVIITLALGIGANSAIFTLVDAVLFQPLPYGDDERLMHLWLTSNRTDFNRSELSLPYYGDFAQSGVFEQIAGYQSRNFALTGTDNPEQVFGGRVTTNFFETLDAQPALGRAFEGGEYRSRVVVISHGLWQRRFGSNPNLVGDSIILNGEPYTVLGVLPQNFHFALTGRSDVWLPLNPTPDEERQRFFYWLKAIVRLRDGITEGQALTEGKSVVERVLVENPRESGTGLELIPLREQIVGPMRSVLLVLFTTVGLVLLIACVNIANLMLARSVSRRHETLIRMALGAGRRRLIQQLLVESLVLSIAGGIAGTLVAQWSLSLLISGLPENQLMAIPSIQGLSINPTVFVAALVVSIVAGLFFGIAPAFQTLSAPSRAPRQRMRQVFVVAEIAVALVLLVGAGLTVKSLFRLMQFETGFNPDRLLTFRVSPPEARYPEDRHIRTFYENLIEKLKQSPGIENAAIVSVLPLTGGGNAGAFLLEGQIITSPSDLNLANNRDVGIDYFRSMQMPVLKGRYFTERDGAEATRVVIINDALAKQYFPEKDPVGQRLVFLTASGRLPIEIVGVVGDIESASLGVASRPAYYFPHAQSSRRNMFVVVRTSGDPSALTTTIRQQVASIDKELPVFAETSMEDLIAGSSSMFTRRYPAFLISAFAGLALLLAAIGIYGVLAYSVGQRMREFGIRVALGARRKDILWLVVRNAVKLSFIGIAIGIALSLLIGRFLSSLMYEVSPTDPFIYAATAIAALTIGLFAAYIPARRATRADPLIALRYE